MSQMYRLKLSRLCEWVLCLLVSVPVSAWAGQMAARKAAFMDDWGFMLVAVAMLAGAWTARYIPTAVDSQIRSPEVAKLVIGLSFGGCSTVALGQTYPQLGAPNLVFPAYLLAAIGTPVMVYAISIASDAETYRVLCGWVKRRLGAEK